MKNFILVLLVLIIGIGVYYYRRSFLQCQAECGAGE